MSEIIFRIDDIIFKWTKECSFYHIWKLSVINLTTSLGQDFKYIIEGDPDLETCKRLKENNKNELVFIK